MKHHGAIDRSIPRRADRLPSNEPKAGHYPPPNTHTLLLQIKRQNSISCARNVRPKSRSSIGVERKRKTAPKNTENKIPQIKRYHVLHIHTTSSRNVLAKIQNTTPPRPHAGRRLGVHLERPQGYLSFPFPSMQRIARPQGGRARKNRLLLPVITAVFSVWTHVCSTCTYVRAQPTSILQPRDRYLLLQQTRAGLPPRGS